MTKFKPGDTVRVKMGLIRWYLGHNGQSEYFQMNGDMDEQQSRMHD